MPYSFLGQDYFAYEEFPFDSKAYYDILRSGVVPTSAALNSEEYKEYFEPYLKMGEDILYIHFSRAMTVSFDNMDIAIKELKELTLSELNDKLVELKDELYKLRFNLAINQLENPMRITAVKKDIARVKTLIREIEIKDSKNA